MSPMPRTRESLEARLLQELLGEVQTNEPAISRSDGARWIELARANRALPRLASRLLARSARVELEESQRQALRMELEDARRRSKTARSVLRLLGRTLREAGIKVMLLKSRALLRPDTLVPGRIPRDLDLLVRRRRWMKRTDSCGQPAACERTLSPLPSIEGFTRVLRTGVLTMIGPSTCSGPSTVPMATSSLHREVFGRSLPSRGVDLGVDVPLRTDACLVTLDDLYERLRRVRDRSTVAARVSGLAAKGDLMRLVEAHEEIAGLEHEEGLALEHRATHLGLGPALRMTVSTLHPFVQGGLGTWADRLSAVGAQDSSGSVARGGAPRLWVRLRRAYRRAALEALGRSAQAKRRATP